MKKLIRSGTIGSGYAARYHFEAIQRVNTATVEVVGAYSPNSARLNAFTSERGINSFESLEELVDASDILHLCTPPVTHEPITLTVLGKNKNIIVEKPFTGYFGDGPETFNGDTFPREDGLKAALESIRRMLDAEKRSKGSIIKIEYCI